MKKTVFSVVAILLVAGCTKQLDGVYEPSKKEDEGSKVEGRIFASARVFPAGVDWQREDCDDRGELILMADGDILCRIADSGPWNSHFIINGQLWEERPSNGRTHILKSGMEEFSWEGEESIWDIASDGKKIYCLCTDDKGTVLRQNGEIIFQRDGVWPASGFYADKGELCFNLHGLELGNMHGSTAMLWKKENLGEFGDGQIRRIRGLDWILNDSLFGSLTKFIHTATDGERFLSLLFDGNAVFVEAYDKNGCYQILTDNNKRLFSSPVKFTRRAVAIDRDDIWALGQLHDGQWAVFHEGQFILLPEEIRAKSGCSLSVRYGRVLFPVILPDGEAGVWDNGKILNLGFNGYVDHISIGRGSSKDFNLSW